MEVAKKESFASLEEDEASFGKPLSDALPFRGLALAVPPPHFSPETQRGCTMADLAEGGRLDPFFKTLVSAVAVSEEYPVI
ncbi:hypothetical protein Q3G72_034552 [Acer saccharum]|nr:hypothetical protein Q3G72_034552 [Acer saccharum]